MWFTILLLVIVVTFYLLSVTIKPKNYPPGPTWYPIVGSFLELKRLSKIFKSQHLVQQHLSNKYQSDVIGLRNGKEKVVVVFNNAAVKAIYKRDEFQARPRTFFLYLRNMGIRKGITIVDGKLWQIQRRFVVTHLKYLGLGKRSMEVFLRDEITEILDSLKENEGKEQRVEEIFIVTILSFLWAFVAGTRLSKDDLILNRLLKILHQRTRAFDIAGGLLNPFPWLRFIAPENTGYNLVLQMNAQIKELLLETINDHYKDWAPGRTDDLIYSFITEMKSSQDPDSTFTEDQLLMLCLDMFMAGSQITTSTLDYVFFAMILYPEVQENCRTCIQKAFRNDEHINYSDRHRVPYIEAVICEVLRLYHVMPVTGPRRATKDTVLENYSIPKDTTILISIYSVHHNKEYWKDPEVFIPERFLDGNGNLFYPEHFIPFSLGKRKCLGDVLARSALFTIFSEIIRNYSVHKYPGTPELTMECKPGITIAPEHYTVQFLRCKPTETMNK